MTALFSFPLSESLAMAAAIHLWWATGASLHLSQHRLELAVLFSVGAALMLCSSLFRKAAALRRATRIQKAAVSSSRVQQVPVTGGVE